jgi:saccharopine dehydrogenase-like NADP-dependent oxidoreductase
VVEPHLREVGCEPLHLHEHAARVAVAVAPLDRDLDVRPLAFPEVADRVVAVLRTRQEYAVVARTAIVAAVVDVGVQPGLVDAPVEHAQAHLLR